MRVNLSKYVKEDWPQWTTCVIDVYGVKGDEVLGITFPNSKLGEILEPIRAEYVYEGRYSIEKRRFENTPDDTFSVVVYRREPSGSLTAITREWYKPNLEGLYQGETGR